MSLRPLPLHAIDLPYIYLQLTWDDQGRTYGINREDESAGAVRDMLRHVLRGFDVQVRHINIYHVDGVNTFSARIIFHEREFYYVTEIASSLGFNRTLASRILRKLRQIERESRK